MKIFVFSDLHGNLNALKEIVNCDDFKSADKIIFLGDVCFGSSRPNKCIELINKHNINCVMGNNDAYIYDHIPEVDKCTFSNGKLTQLDWMDKNITKKNKNIISKWEKSLTLSLNNKILYFTHYVWEYYNGEYNVIDTDDIPNLDNRKKLFLGVDADYYIYGHEHRYHYFKDENKHYICTPSAGLQSPAEYILIESNDEEIFITKKSLEFDEKEEIDLIKKAGYPHNK